MTAIACARQHGGGADERRDDLRDERAPGARRTDKTAPSASRKPDAAPNSPARGERGIEGQPMRAALERADIGERQRAAARSPRRPRNPSARTRAASRRRGADRRGEQEIEIAALIRAARHRRHRARDRPGQHEQRRAARREFGQKARRPGSPRRAPRTARPAIADRMQQHEHDAEQDQQFHPRRTVAEHAGERPPARSLRSRRRGGIMRARSRRARRQVEEHVLERRRRPPTPARNSSSVPSAMSRPPCENADAVGDALGDFENVGGQDDRSRRRRRARRAGP